VKIMLDVPARGIEDSVVFSIVAKIFPRFSVTTITYINHCTKLDEISRTCTLTTFRSLLNINIIGQRLRSITWIICASLSALHTPVVLSFKRGGFYFIKIIIHRKSKCY